MTKSQDRPTAFHHEFAHLIEIERYKLLDLEDVDAISKANIFSQRFRDGETSLPRDEDWAMPIIEIVPAALDRRFPGRCRKRGIPTVAMKEKSPPLR